MSFNYNRVMLSGNLTRDPEVRVIGTDRHVANFGLAINRRFKANGETREETTFVDIEAWGRTAELVGQYLVKGRGCFVEGRLKLDTWTDDSGQKRSRLKVVADSIQFTGARAQGQGEAAEADAHPDVGDVRRSVTRAASAAAGANDEPPF